MSIIISKNGKHAQKLNRADFQKEDYLQDYIHNNPESIPVYELSEDKRLFVAMREFPTNSGPIDALAIDKDGDIYIVETKLYKNPDKRTVVAQALDYGAALWKYFNDFNEFINILDQQTQNKFNLSFKEKIKEFFNLDDEQVELAYEQMRKNLNEGNLKFVILMDSLDERLKNLILYVNQNSQFDVYAVQLEYYKFEEYEIMIPKLFGVEVKKNIGVSSSSQRKQWDEQSFIEQTKKELTNQADKIINLYQYFKQNADKINWGTGYTHGSFSPVFNNLNETIGPFTVYSDGKIQLKFGWILAHTPKEKAEKPINNFIDEFQKNTKLKLTDIYSSESHTILPKDFMNNYEGISKTITNFVKKL